MKKQMTLVYYYVPQDKDDPEVPNVFGVNIKKDQIRLKHLHQNFPIAGEYIFRFKVLYQNNLAWLDLPDPNAKLPTFKEKIMIKASRVSWENKKSVYQNKNQQPQHQNQQAQHQNRVVGSPVHSNDVSFKSLGNKPQPVIPKSPTKIQSNKKATQNFNLIDDEHLHHSTSNNQNNHGDSLL